MPRFAGILFACVLFAPAAWAEQPLPVEFVQVRHIDLTFDAALTGTITAKDSVDIGFRQGGRVTEVLVDDGDHVSAGQALARTDPLQQEQAMRVAQAAMASAQATQAQAQQVLERAQAMLTRGVGTQAAFDVASQNLSAATGGLAQARTALEQAQHALDDTVIRAPTEAIVTARLAEPGQIVGAAQAVVSLASATGREVIFQTPDSPLLRGAIGTAVSLSGLDFRDLRMNASITEIAPLVDPATGSVTVRAEIRDAPLTTSLLGTAVQGAVHYPAGSAIAVPWTALTSAHGQPAVWLVGKDNRVALTPVEIARFMSGIVILDGGLLPGQKVVGAGSQMMYPGREVVPAADRVQ